MRASQMCCQLVDAGLEYQLAVTNDLHVAADGLHFGQDVRGQDHAVRLSKVADQAADFLNLDRVQAHGGLVQDHHRRVVDNRLGDADALLETLGDVADQAPTDVLKAAAGLGLFARCAHLPSRDPAQAGTEIKVFVDRQVAVQRRGFGQVAQLRLGVHRLLQHVDAADPHAPGAGCQSAGQDAHGGGLAGAVGAQEAQHLALHHAEADIAQHFAVAEAAADVLDLYEDFGRHG